jgi:hypothetical protein
MVSLAVYRAYQGAARSRPAGVVQEHELLAPNVAPATPALARNAPVPWTLAAPLGPDCPARLAGTFYLLSLDRRRCACAGADGRTR